MATPTTDRAAVHSEMIRADAVRVGDRVHSRPTGQFRLVDKVVMRRFLIGLALVASFSVGAALPVPQAAPAGYVLAPVCVFDDGTIPPGGDVGNGAGESFIASDPDPDNGRLARAIDYAWDGRAPIYVPAP